MEENSKEDLNGKQVDQNTIQIALRFCYLGTDYSGFASQESSEKTIEHCLFQALLTTQLIESRQTCQYTRCARTDKGVSSLANVVSLRVKKIQKAVESKDLRVYCKIINSKLPQEIRITAACSVPNDFSARFSCLWREYKYYFFQDKLDIQKMQQAAQLYLGVHNFKNFCKTDPRKPKNPIREVLEVEVIACEKFPQLWYFRVKGGSFLWHQIRFMVQILFKIGQGIEEPDVINQLFDVECWTEKPGYQPADEFNLMLTRCGFDEETVKWQLSNDIKSKEIVQSLMKKIIIQNQILITFYEEISLGCEGFEEQKVQKRQKKLIELPCFKKAKLTSN